MSYYVPLCLKHPEAINAVLYASIGTAPLAAIFMLLGLPSTGRSRAILGTVQAVLGLVSVLLTVVMHHDVGEYACFETIEVLIVAGSLFGDGDSMRTWHLLQAAKLCSIAACSVGLTSALNLLFRNKGGSINQVHPSIP